MRHQKKRKFQIGYDKGRRLMRALATSLVLHEKIRTTEKRGKLVKSEVEKLISKGKIGDLHNKRQLFAALPSNAARKVFEVLGPKYKERKGGYARVLHLGKAKDGAAEVLVELV